MSWICVERCIISTISAIVSAATRDSSFSTPASNPSSAWPRPTTVRCAQRSEEVGCKAAIGPGRA